MILLYTLAPRWGIASISPACLKLETWLRMAKLPYETAIATLANFEIAPKGKLPFIRYRDQLFGDSTLIIAMLKQSEGVDPDRDLTTSERAISIAFRRMVKENLYWGGVYIRYEIEENWLAYQETLKELVGQGMSTEEWREIAQGIYDSVRSQLEGHGMGRHSGPEITQIICEDIQALSDFLGDKPFFMGDQPTTLDATVYGYIANYIRPPYPSPIVDYALQRSNLCQHCDRMTERYFPELLG